MCTSVLTDIRKIFADCKTDEKAFRKKVLANLNENIPDSEGIKAEIESLEKQIIKEKNKYKKIYNDYYDGIIKNAEMFEEMSGECNDRIEAFTDRKSKLTAELNKNRVCCEDVVSFMNLLGRFSEIEELTPEILNTLISVIEVGEKVQNSPTETIQNVSVSYKFINQYC